MSIFDERPGSKANWKVNLPVLWLGVFLACASFSSCIPFLPVYLLKELQVEQEQVRFWSGLVYAITFLGSSLMAPCWGALADRVGQRKMAIRAGFGLALTYWLTGICQNEYQLFLVRALCGLISGFVPAAMSLVSSTLPQERLGWGMGLMQTAAASGSITGPLLGGYLSSWFGMRMSFFVGAVFLSVATMLVVFLVHDVPLSKERQRQALHLFHDLGLALRNRELVYTMAMFFTVQSCVMLVQPLITLYVGQLMGRMDDAAIKMAGVVFSLAGIAGILAAPFWGKRGQRFGYMRIFCLVCLGAGLVDLCQVAVSSVGQFALVQFTYGLFLAGAVPSINANVATITGKEERGKAFGLLTSAQQMGGVAGPILGGFLGNLVETRFVFVFISCVLLTSSAYTYLTRVRGRPAHP